MSGATDLGTRFDGGRPAGTRLFLIADDLTGALDAAARFASPSAPVPVLWRLPDATIGDRVVLDSATREVGPDMAAARVAALLASRPHDDGTILYAKLDSLLRGNAAAEIGAWLAAVRPRRCIVAPAFPQQGRIGRGGRQIFARDGAWIATACDLVADLRAAGHDVTLCRPGAAVPDGISFWDAETVADLAAIAAAGDACPGTTLWSGSGGLASALAAHRAGGGLAEASVGALRGPILGLFGTDHPVMLGQIAAMADDLLALSAGDETAAVRVRGALARQGLALVRPDLPAGLDRSDAAARIERLFADLTARLDPPGTLVVAGGETLRGLCVALAVDRLDLEGELTPGVPVSRIRGGRFDGVRVVSKSGAFGPPDLLRRLLVVAPLNSEPERNCP